MFLRRPPCLVWRSLFGKRQLKGWKSSSWDVLFRAVPETYWRSQCASYKSLPSIIHSPTVSVALEWDVHMKSHTRRKMKKKAWERSSNPAHFHTWPITAWRGCEQASQTLLDDWTSTFVWSILRPWVVPSLTSSIMNVNPAVTAAETSLLQNQSQRFVLFALPSIFTTCWSRASMWTTAQISVRLATDSHCPQWILMISFRYIHASHHLLDYHEILRHFHVPKGMNICTFDLKEPLNMLPSRIHNMHPANCICNYGSMNPGWPSETGCEPWISSSQDEWNRSLHTES